MRAIRAFVLRLVGTFGAGRRDREIAEELAAHRDMLEREYRDAGLGEQEARRAAAVEFGSLESAAAAYQDRRGFPTLDSWVRDVRYAITSLRRSPVLTLSIVLVLGMGIGLSTSLATVIHSIGWQTLPVPEPDRVIRLALSLQGEVSRHVRGRESWFSYPELTDYRDSTHALESVAGVDYEDVLWRTDMDVRPLSAALVTGDYFRVLPVAAIRGRLLAPGDSQQAVVVISHVFWTKSLAGRADVVGSSIVLDRSSYVIAGVVEERFSGTDAAPVDIWVPLEAASRLRGDAASLAERNFSWLQVIGRLARTSSLPTAASEAAVIAARLDHGYPGRHMTIAVSRASRFDPGLLTSHDRTLTIASGAVAAVVMAVLLLICGSNAAVLLLARGAMRGKEFALRMALGAGRGRVAQQLIAEVITLAVASALIGVMMCTLSLNVLAIWLPIRGVVGSLSPDLRIFAFALTFALAVACLFGLAPVRQALQVDCLTGLKSDPGGLPARRVRGWLVSVQVAVSVILLVTAALFSRGVEQASRADPGYSAKGLYIVRPERVSIPGASAAALSRFTKQLGAALAERPGVVIVGATMTGPFWGTGTTQVRLDTTSEPVSVRYDKFDDDAFRALGVTPVVGRLVPRSEPDAVLVNSSFAHRFWHDDRAALDHVLQIPADAVGAVSRPVRIAGVIPTLQTANVGVPDEPTYYLPVTPRDPSPGVLLVRAIDGTPVPRMVTVAVQSLSPGAFANVVSVEQRMRMQTEPARVGAAIAGLIGGLGLLVAAIGLHGIVAHAVISRTRDIAIRLALGAPPARLLRVILESSLRGVVLGAVAGAGILATLLWSLPAAFRPILFGVNPLDPAAFLAGGLALAIVIVAAAYWPARRALRIAPIDALRHGT